MSERRDPFDYEDLLADSDSQSERLAAFAGLSERLTQETRDEIRAFLRPPRLGRVTSTDSRIRAGHPAHAEYARIQSTFRG